MRNLALWALFIVLISSCKQQDSSTQSASAAPNFAAGSCNIGKWTNLVAPLNLKMSAEFVGDYTNADLVGGLNPLEQMAKVWNDSVAPATTLFQLPFGATATAGSNTLSNYHDNEMGIYKSHTWFAGVSSSALAITQFYGIVRSDPSLGTYIDLTHADIIVNYRDFGADLTMTNNPLIDYDLPTIVLHEMGHFLGLCHESNHASVMAPYYFTTQRTLKAFDTSKIRGLYINNQNVNAITVRPNPNALITIDPSVGKAVNGFIELNADGLCRHYVEGKLVYQHETQMNGMASLPRPKWYKSLPLR
jgi:hypothetical protein